MTSYLYPGVTVTTSLNPLLNDITGVPANAVQVFALPYNIGPDVPTLVTSWQQFIGLYGNFSVANGSLLHYAVYQFFYNGGGACYVLRLPNTDATSSSVVLQDINTPSADNVLTVTASSPGAWGTNIQVEVIAAGSSTSTAGGYFNLNVYDLTVSSNVPVESWISLIMNPADPRYIASIINAPGAGSNYIDVAVSLPDSTYTAGETDLAPIAPTSLSGGTDGSTAPTVGTAVPTAMASMSNAIVNLNVPGWTNITDLNNLITWADNQPYVFLFIDGPTPSGDNLTSAQVASSYINMVTGSGVLHATPNAAIYGPWLQIGDPASSLAGATRFVPACGAVMGICNNVDTNVGPQQSPAGVTYAQVNAIALQANFTPTDLTNLEISQVNPIKMVPGYGFCVYGARTLKPNYPDRYISVQRVLMQLAHDAVNLTQFAIFEPNDPQLWAQITQVLTNYLSNQYSANVIGGGVQQSSAYQVICDASNNTPATAQAGIVHVSISVALLSPAEFITINISQLPSGNATVTTS